MYVHELIEQLEAIRAEGYNNVDARWWALYKEWAWGEWKPKLGKIQDVYKKLYKDEGKIIDIQHRIAPVVFTANQEGIRNIEKFKRDWENIKKRLDKFEAESGAGGLATSDIRSEGKESNPSFGIFPHAEWIGGQVVETGQGLVVREVAGGVPYSRMTPLRTGGNKKVLQKIADKMMRQTNPGLLSSLFGSKEATPAEENFEHFHGIESEEQITDELDWPPPEDLDDYGPFPARLPELTALGELVELTYEDPDTLDDCLISFDKPRPLLASDYGPEGSEDLFIVGGEYSIDGDDMILGCLLSIVYQTKKSFDDSKPIPYKHRMAEPFPVLATNEDGTQLYILRGESKFSIDRGQPVSAGIVG